MVKARNPEGFLAFFTLKKIIKLTFFKVAPLNKYIYICVLNSKININLKQKKKMEIEKTNAAPALQAVQAVEEVSGRYRNVAIGVKGSVRETARIDMGAGHNDVNNIVQFDITNTQAGAITELVRIGSWLGQPDAYAQFNTTKSGADGVNGISDNFGTNLLKCQGFSSITVGTPVFIKTIKVISSSTTQLTQQFSHKTILPDFTIIPLVQNIAFTREKQDQATDLLVAKGSWLLSSRDFLEFSSILATSVSLIFELASISDVRQFVKF